jgi:phosphatidylserine/phosphatidylglycerophosphate/cardiolipin synthase-like enzyme
MKTVQVIDGIPYRLRATPGNPESDVKFVHECCDCNLRHDVKIDIPAEVKGIDVTFNALDQRGKTPISLHAENVYPIWKKMVKSAKFRIVVFSPFLDSSLLQLLKNAAIPADRIHLVTDFSGQTLLEHPAQLKTIHALLQSGIEVKHLPRLHAKVLLVDRGSIALGSQNFTRAGKKNREVSSAFPNNRLSRPFADILLEWREEAKAIDPLLMEELLGKLEPLHRQHERLVKDAQQIIKESTRV